MAEVVSVLTQFTVAVDVGAMEQMGRAKYGDGWSVAWMLTVFGELMERGYAPMLYRELLAVRGLPPGQLEQAQAKLGPHTSLIQAGLSSVDHPTAQVRVLPRPDGPVEG